MEEKTEQLRDIFMEVADEESVTESQAQQRGSLLPGDSVDDRLADVAVQFTADAQEDGLEEAAEDIETDVEF